MAEQKKDWQGWVAVAEAGGGGTSRGCSVADCPPIPLYTAAMADPPGLRYSGTRAKPRPSNLCTQGQDPWLDWGPVTGNPGGGTLESPREPTGGGGVACPIQLSGTYSRFSIDMVEDLDQGNLQML